MTSKYPRTTNEQYDGLFAAVNESRKDSKVIKVDKEALFNLLQDHGDLWGELDKRERLSA